MSRCGGSLYDHDTPKEEWDEDHKYQPPSVPSCLLTFLLLSGSIIGSIIGVCFALVALVC